MVGHTILPSIRRAPATLRGGIVAGHKMARHTSAIGQPIRHFGRVIGYGIADITAVYHVHTRNCPIGDHEVLTPADPSPDARGQRSMRMRSRLDQTAISGEPPTRAAANGKETSLADRAATTNGRTRSSRLLVHRRNPCVPRAGQDLGPLPCPMRCMGTIVQPTALCLCHPHPRGGIVLLSAVPSCGGSGRSRRARPVRRLLHCIAVPGAVAE